MTKYLKLFEDWDPEEDWDEVVNPHDQFASGTFEWTPELLEKAVVNFNNFLIELNDYILKRTDGKFEIERHDYGTVSQLGINGGFKTTMEIGGTRGYFGGTHPIKPYNIESMIKSHRFTIDINLKTSSSFIDLCLNYNLHGLKFVPGNYAIADSPFRKVFSDVEKRVLLGNELYLAIRALCNGKTPDNKGVRPSVKPIVKYWLDIAESAPIFKIL